nr:MAG TPA: Z DNA-binding protein [Caudoviricetes sp.]
MEDKNKTYTEFLEQMVSDHSDFEEILMKLNDELYSALKEIAESLGLKKKFTIDEILYKIEILKGGD